MNFFEPACQEPPRTDAKFGICDDREGLPAYTNHLETSRWTATVVNLDPPIALTFTAIDKCVIQDHEETGRGRCDGMLISANHLYFIELKDQQANWIPHAIEQLESTIQYFLAHHDLSAFQHKKAFACNRKHPRFQEIDQATNLRFFRKYKVRIDIQAHVIVV